MKMTHKHDVYFSPHSPEAHSLVMQIADYCNKRGIWYKISESTLGIGIQYGGNVGYVIDTDCKTENSSEKPNNCEHITEDGVTCAKYPACDDCPDNPLNKVKGSERLLKGKDEPQKKEVEWVYNKRERLWYPYSNGELLFKTEPQTDCYVSDLCKHYGDKQICGRCRSRNLFCEAEPQPRCPKCGKRGYIRSLESMGVKLKVFDEYKWKCTNCNKYFKEEPKDEPQTDCAWR